MSASINSIRAGMGMLQAANHTTAIICPIIEQLPANNLRRELMAAIRRRDENTATASRK